MCLVFMLSMYYLLLVGKVSVFLKQKNFSPFFSFANVFNKIIGRLYPFFSHAAPNFF